MNKLLLLIFGFVLLTSSYYQTKKPKTKSTDQLAVEGNVLKWADSVFYFHENYRFEQFHAFYSEEYEIALLREEMYADKLETLEKLKSKGYYKKTDQEYEQEHAELVKKNLELSQLVQNFENKADRYEILFWSNIKTNHGITVYYSFTMTLNNKFEVIKADKKSEIGKKNEKTKILYAKDVKRKK